MFIQKINAIAMTIFGPLSLCTWLFWDSTHTKVSSFSTYKFIFLTSLFSETTKMYSPALWSKMYLQGKFPCDRSPCCEVCPAKSRADEAHLAWPPQVPALTCLRASPPHSHLLPGHGRCRFFLGAGGRPWKKEETSHVNRQMKMTSFFITFYYRRVFFLQIAYSSSRNSHTEEVQKGKGDGLMTSLGHDLTWGE